MTKKKQKQNESLWYSQEFLEYDVFRKTMLFKWPKFKIAVV